MAALSTDTRDTSPDGMNTVEDSPLAQRRRIRTYEQSALNPSRRPSGLRAIRGAGLANAWH